MRIENDNPNHLISFLDDPGTIESITPGEASEMLVKITALLPLLAIKAQANGAQSPRPEGDTLLTVQEASKILGCTEDWLYRKADSFSFTKRIGPRQLRFSRNGIQKYIKSR
jgi:predicted DNA-binding transcriptional regulator AlpA